MLKFYNVVLFTLHLNFTGSYYLYPEEGKSFVFELIPYPNQKMPTQFKICVLNECVRWNQLPCVVLRSFTSVVF